MDFKRNLLFLFTFSAIFLVGCGTKPAESQQSHVKALVDTKNRIVLVFTSASDGNYSLRACTAKKTLPEVSNNGMWYSDHDSKNFIVETSLEACINPLKTPDGKPATFTAIPTQTLDSLSQRGLIKRAAGYVLAGTAVTLVTTASLGSLGILPGVAMTLGAGAGGILVVGGFMPFIKAGLPESTDTLKDIQVTRNAQVQRANAQMAQIEEKIQALRLKAAGKEQEIAQDIQTAIADKKSIDDALKLANQERDVQNTVVISLQQSAENAKKATDISSYLEVLNKDLITKKQVLANVKKEYTDVVEATIRNKPNISFEELKKLLAPFGNLIEKRELSLGKNGTIYATYPWGSGSESYTNLMWHIEPQSPGKIFAAEQALEQAQQAVKNVDSNVARIFKEAGIIAEKSKVTKWIANGVHGLTIATAAVSVAELSRWLTKFGASEIEAGDRWFSDDARSFCTRKDITIPECRAFNPMSSDASAIELIKIIADELNLQVALQQ